MSEVNLDAARDILGRIDLSEKLTNGKIKPDYLIPLLQDIQEEYGYLPRPALELISREGGIPLSRIFGVVTFYEQFYLEPRGKHMVKCCRGTACHVKNGAKIASAISDVLGIGEGGTSADGLFTFETVACLGTCFLAPVMMIDESYYGNLEEGDVKSILDRYREGGVK
ncbi:MAG: NAD(P)H-dependent oxidoreductase subunit E [Spirochaetales bacterium]|nr:NAD(P)H-dependent oxidoreductase subunit E [Spirochaetales bacterium]